jgi:hypothetical protein
LWANLRGPLSAVQAAGAWFAGLRDRHALRRAGPGTGQSRHAYDGYVGAALAGRNLVYREALLTVVVHARGGRADEFFAISRGPARSTGSDSAPPHSTARVGRRGTCGTFLFGQDIAPVVGCSHVREARIRGGRVERRRAARMKALLALGLVQGLARCPIRPRAARDEDRAILAREKAAECRRCRGGRRRTIRNRLNGIDPPAASGGKDHEGGYASWNPAAEGPGSSLAPSGFRHACGQSNSAGILALAEGGGGGPAVCHVTPRAAASRRRRPPGRPRAPS